MATINLTKGGTPVNLVKGSPIRLELSWPADTDYDAGAEILYRDGSTESIATFEARGTDARTTSLTGSVRHSGDAGQWTEGTATETITVDPDPTIAAVAFWVYSAQSNGTGSFYRYAVSVKVSCGDDTVSVEAANASRDDRVYTCVPAIIRFNADCVPSIGWANASKGIERYSEPGSEARPRWTTGRSLLGRKTAEPILSMVGPRNAWK